MYIQLVFVKFSGRFLDGKFLYQAPAWTDLKKGDLVMCDTVDGLKQGTVVATDCFEIGGKDYCNWIDIAETKQPLKKIAGIFKKLDYPDDAVQEEQGHGEKM